MKVLYSFCNAFKCLYITVLYIQLWVVSAIQLFVFTHSVFAYSLSFPPSLRPVNQSRSSYMLCTYFEKGSRYASLRLLILVAQQHHARLVYLYLTVKYLVWVFVCSELRLRLDLIVQLLYSHVPQLFNVFQLIPHQNSVRKDSFLLLITKISQDFSREHLADDEWDCDSH